MIGDLLAGFPRGLRDYKRKFSDITVLMTAQGICPCLQVQIYRHIWKLGADML
jgi:hypothetical protein